MANNEKTSQGQPTGQGVDKSKEQYNKESKDMTERILKQLENGELNENIKIIIVIGHAGAGKTSLLKLITGEDIPLGHTLDAGTAIPSIIPAYINGEFIMFIDSPGFGHATARRGVIKAQIQSLLGFFTRALGGVHGILYVQDITAVRTTPGMQEATEFLDELASEAIRPNITFITTKWDSVALKLLPRCESRERELKRDTWKNFNLETLGGSRYFRHGVDCEVDSQRDQEHGRNQLMSSVMAHYTNVSAQSLRMPFTESKYYKQGVKIATITGKVVIISGVVVGAIVIAAQLGLMMVSAVGSAIASGKLTFFFEAGFI